MKQIIVVGAIIINGDKFLITQRKENAMIDPLLWEFPGGKVEFNEHPKDALIREIKEELDIDIAHLELFDISSGILKKDEDSIHAIMIVYTCKIQKGILKNQDVKDHRWITIDQLKDYPLATLDVPIIPILKKRFNIPIQHQQD